MMGMKMMMMCHEDEDDDDDDEEANDDWRWWLPRWAGALTPFHPAAYTSYSCLCDLPQPKAW